METFMNGAMVIEGEVLSFLLALCMTWLGLNGLFRLMPSAPRPEAAHMGRQMQMSAGLPASDHRA
jgi:hypothetical protein